ncbi:Uncharacterized protein DAT39_017051 [Clarias magur]|uniref:Uncharacterized protein n=1 Tax=Clarias magur TaxID=1594786 RepID=A0A8J4U790_CLAMG|nr:Uncharacterized protein DAT39_017051 [Clarias magur]
MAGACAPAMALGTTGARKSSLKTDNRTGQPAERKLTFRCGSSSYLGRASQSGSSCQTCPGEWDKFSLIAIRNRDGARLSISSGLNKDLNCCTQKQRSSLHGYATSQF